MLLCPSCKIHFVQYESCEGSQATLIDPGLNVFVSDALQVDHCRGDVPVPHPLLERADIDSVLEIPCRIGVPEFVQKPSRTVGAFGTTVDPHRSVFELM